MEVPAVAVLYGLVSAALLTATADLTVLAQEDDYAFVSTRVPLVLRFTGRALPLLDIAYDGGRVSRGDQGA
jgi:hypothetical protein